MAKKKKKSKSGQHGFEHLTMEQLIRKGEQFIEAEKPRDAVSVFKFIIKKHGKSDKLNVLVFRAYLMREQELRKKNMIPEADAVRQQAREYMPDIQSLSENDMAAYISNCSNKDAFHAYLQYITANTKSPRIEQLLANRLFKSNCWELTDKLDKSSLLRRDAAIVQHAVSLMNDGKWEESLKALQPISRISPFSSVRMFCRGMVSFYAEDNTDAFKAFSMIPDDFPLNHVVKNLKKIVANPGNPVEKQQAMSAMQCLWDSPVNLEKNIPALLYDLEHKRFRQAKAFICQFADTIYPQQPETARIFILEILWTMMFQDKIEDDELETLAKDLLSEDAAEMLLAKTELLRFERPFTAAGNYISLLEKEFPNPAKKQIAHGFILQDMVMRAHEFRDKVNIMQDKKGIQTYGNLLGIKSKPHDMILLEIITESIRLDPINRSAYELLVKLPRHSRPAKKIAETALTSMLQHFPDDPFPCLELASLYYETHAFRKAENILEEAMKRAPHDNRVIDRYALSLLISAEKNLNRKKFHLVARDIERAEQLKSKKAVPFIVEKRIVFQLLNDQIDTQEAFPPASDESPQPLLFDSGKDLKTIIDHEMTSFSLAERLKTLAMLSLDIKERTIDQKDSPRSQAPAWEREIVKELEKIMNKEMKQIKTLSSPEVSKLLMPPDKEYAEILPCQNLAPFFLKNWKNMLRFVEDAQVIPLYELIFAPNVFGLIKKDIKQRLKKAKKNDRLLLEFHLLITEHISGKKQKAESFQNIIEQAGGTLKEELRGISRKFSKHTSGVFKKALEMFDFTILEDFFPHDIDDEDMDALFPLSDDDMDGGFDKLMDMLEFLEPEPGMIEKELTGELVENFEEFIDDLEIRGAPEFMIYGLREMLRADPKTRREFDMLAKLLEKSKGTSRLSREAQLILFGKRKKK